MSATRDVTIWCDNQAWPCRAWFGQAGYHTTSEARGAARKDGWTLRAGKDYCRACSASLRATKAMRTSDWKLGKRVAR